MQQQYPPYPVHTSLFSLKCLTERLLGWLACSCAAAAAATNPRLAPCRDAKAALEWLEKAAGFTTLCMKPGEGEAVAHAELKLGTSTSKTQSQALHPAQADRQAQW